MADGVMCAEWRMEGHRSDGEDEDDGQYDED
jgi:hypothetical protein